MNLPEGWKLVPVEPTQEMHAARYRIPLEHRNARAEWDAMLAAAPTPPAQGDLGCESGCGCDLCNPNSHILTAQEKEYSCPCGVGAEPCPDENGKPLCDDTPAQEGEPRLVSYGINLETCTLNSKGQEYYFVRESSQVQEDEPFAYAYSYEPGEDGAQQICDLTFIRKDYMLNRPLCRETKLYTRPDDDKLRKAAEAVDLLESLTVNDEFDRNDGPAITANLRAELERK